MNIELILKIISALVALIGAWKIISELFSGNMAKLRQDYIFSRDFLKDIQSDTLHPYAIEKGYQALAGSKDVKSEEVAYILSLEKPAKCLKNFVLGKKYLEHLSGKTNQSIKFKEKYKNNFSRLWRKASYLCLYAINGFLALGPFLLGAYLHFDLKIIAELMLFMFPTFGFFAITFIKDFVQILCAEELVQSQKQHKNFIVTGQD